MSPPTDAKTGTGQATLIADGAPGVDILIINSHLRPVARGVTKLEVLLPEGVYTVRFSAGGRAEDKPVRLRAIEKPLLVEGGQFAIGSAPPSASSDVGEIERAQAHAVATFAQMAPKQGYDELVVFVRAPGATHADASRSIRLFDAKDVAMRSRDEEALEADRVVNENEHGWAARRYRVRAGVYRLHYEASSRKMVEQTVYVFPGRRTFAFLKYGHAVELVQQDGGYKPVRRRGVAPEQTTLVSAAASDPNPDPDDLRLADILLHALGSSAVGLDQNLMVGLAKPDGCPYLKLYASAVLVRRLEDAIAAAAVNDEPSAFEAISPEVSRSWLEETCIKLLRSMPQGQPWPDAQCCGWRLAALTENRFSIDLNDALSAPPMLDCSWQWAVAHSFDRPGALPSAGAFRPASEARVQAAPWLVWRSAAISSWPQASSVVAKDVTASLAESRDRARLDRAEKSGWIFLRRENPGGRARSAGVRHLDAAGAPNRQHPPASRPRPGRSIALDRRQDCRQQLGGAPGESARMGGRHPGAASQAEGKDLRRGAAAEAPCRSHEARRAALLRGRGKALLKISRPALRLRNPALLAVGTNASFFPAKKSNGFSAQTYSGHAMAGRS